MYKKIERRITPTCIKETLERKKARMKVDEGEEMTRDEFPEERESNNSRRIDLQPTFESNRPYPTLTNVMPNRADVRQLKMLTSGRNGALTDFLTLYYQSFILKDNYTDIARQLGDIGNVGLKHYKLLSEAIVDFGGNPNLSNGQGDMWTGRNISTEKDIKRILRDNIRMKERNITTYKRAAGETQNTSLASLYLRLAEDDTLQIPILRDLSEEIN